MSSLLQRLATATVIIPVVVWLVMVAPDMAFVFALSLIVLIAGYEWSALSGIGSQFNKYLIAVIMLFVAHGLILLNEDVLYFLMVASLFFWLIVIASIVAKPQRMLDMYVKQWLMVLLGLVVVALTFLSLYQIRLGFTQGADLLMYLLLLIWIADTGAYFVGQTFGRHKLSPIVSPGKSIEGVLGGLIACIVFSYFGSSYFNSQSGVGFVVASLLVALISVYGDLFESLMKRRANVKDSGNILPGHGGVLDRIDSLISAGPSYLAIILLGGLL